MKARGCRPSAVLALRRSYHASGMESFSTLWKSVTIVSASTPVLGTEKIPDKKTNRQNQRLQELIDSGG